LLNCFSYLVKKIKNKKKQRREERMNKTIVKSKIQSLSLSLSPPDHSCHFLSLHIFKLWAPHIAGPPQKHLTRWSFFGVQDQQRKLIRRSQSTETWGIPCSSSYFLYPIPVKAAENAFSNYDPVEIKYFLSKKKGRNWTVITNSVCYPPIFDCASE